MDSNIHTDDGQHDDLEIMVPQFNDRGDKKGLRGTPKTGSGAKRSAPTTPSRRGRGGARGRGHGASNATTPSRSTRSTTTAGGRTYTTAIGNIRVTDLTDIHKGPPGAAYVTLRCERSLRFKSFLQQLREISQELDLRPPDSTKALSILPEHLRKLSPVYANPSPPDSGVDVLTPEPDIKQVVSGNEQSTQDVSAMGPVREISQSERDRLRERNQQVEVVSDSLKDVIHNFYEIQTQVQGYVSETETRDVLVNKMQELSQALARLSQGSSSNAITSTFVPPEVVDYVDDGRNPDIYTRELVEVVQRGNAVLNGKMNAFGSFSEIFANDLRKISPAMAKAVDEIMNGRGADGDVKQENGGG